MSVPVTLTPTLEFGKVERLFPLAPGRRWSDYAPTADGRFLVMQQVQFAGLQPVTVIANWTPPVR